MSMYLANAFSLNMLAEMPASVEVSAIPLEEAQKWVDVDHTSVVGHVDTAAVFSNTLGFEVLPNRATVTLNKGDVVLVGQYKGPRLEEGTTVLPAGATIQWLLVSVA